jgi:membrane-associated phospholipid phosphatase
MEKKLLSTLGLIAFIFYQNINAQSPYKLNWKKESVLFGTGLVSAIIASDIDEKVKPLTEFEINQLKKNNVNSFDRSATNNYSKSISNLSDIVVLSCAASPILFLSGKQPRHDFGIISVMYLETMLYSVFLPSYGKGGALRIRPYAYNSATPLDEKLNAETRRSFFSGHTTVAFSSAVFLASVYSNYYPHSKLKPFVWSASLIAASGVGFLRYKAGAHFPTDILVGAAVGAAVGYFVPLLHKTRKNNDVTFIPIIQKNKTGLTIVWKLNGKKVLI